MHLRPLTLSQQRQIVTGPWAFMRRLSLFGMLASLAVTTACAAAGSTAAVSGTRSAPDAVTAADVQFMQGMLVHHAQALAMTELVPARTASDDIRLLAERISISQQDEMAMMQAWLRSGGHQVPDLEHASHGPHTRQAMPGMASETELPELRAASGTDFDRHFLQLMVRHHEGALVMVARLFETGDAAQRPDVYRVVAEIDSDQRAEIARMRALLSSMASGR